MNHIDQFLKNKVAEMRRAAPDCDVWLFPEAQGYTVYSAITRPRALSLQEVDTFVETRTARGLNVALLDRVSLGQHGGWKTILIAKIPATKKIETEGDFA
jgi:hypothetical protein